MVLASGALAKLISYFIVRPDDTPHTRSLMRNTALGARSLQIEYARLERMGLLARESAPDGRVTIRATNERELWAPFRALVRAYADSTDLLRFALVDVPNISTAFVFGSVARGTADEQSDVDLCVISASDNDTAFAALERTVVQRSIEASLAIGREVNVVTLTPARLNQKLVEEGKFYTNLVAGANRWVVGTPDQLDRFRTSAHSASARHHD